MLVPTEIFVFAGAALLLVLSPGPNMVYLLSRSACQGRRAGVTSLVGVMVGFVLHMLAAAAGLSAVFVAVPFAYEVIKWLGACYLLWLAWQALAGRRHSLRGDMPKESPAQLFRAGLFTNLLNPKATMFYLALLPQFVSPDRGSPFFQSLMLGGIQIAISFFVNLAIVIAAARTVSWLSENPKWIMVQRYMMSTVLVALAVKLLTEQKRAL